jgi:Rps23 Pro-64 3,4-dihydroxylase Tpa1-like proline 4-hydroxylase
MIGSQPRAAYNLKEVVSSGLINGAGPLSCEFSRAKPFPYVLIDGFFKPEIASSVVNGINSLLDSQYRVSFRSLAQRKLQLGKISAVAPHLLPAYEVLMGSEFTQFIEQVSGHPGLSADRQFAGAGLHRYGDRGFSEIHLDSNRHPFDPDLHHRVNLLIFMNPAWRSEWGGELVLWSSDDGKPKGPEVIISPVFNRAVIFSVTRKSWHSVSPIRCPHERARNSMAIYYFNRITTEEDERPRSVIWHATGGWPRQAIFEVTNRAVTMAKPWARYLRWLRSNKFDGVLALH